MTDFEIDVLMNDVKDGVVNHKLYGTGYLAELLQRAGNCIQSLKIERSENEGE